MEVAVALPLLPPLDPFDFPTVIEGVSTCREEIVRLDAPGFKGVSLAILFFNCKILMANAREVFFDSWVTCPDPDEVV